jgi:hypothetical protein
MAMAMGRSIGDARCAALALLLLLALENRAVIAIDHSE